MSIILSEEDPFERALIDIVATHRDKGADYEVPDGPWDSFAFVGHAMDLATEEVIDVLVLNKYARLRALRLNDRSPVHESVQDSRLDIAVFAIMAYAIARAEAEGQQPKPQPLVFVHTLESK